MDYNEQNQNQVQPDVTSPPEPTAPLAQAAPVQPSIEQAHASNGLAITSFVLGILAIVTALLPVVGLILSITALVLGIIALRGNKPLKGLAISGIATGAIGLIWALFVTIGLFALMASYSESGTTTPQGTFEQQEVHDSHEGHMH